MDGNCPFSKEDIKWPTGTRTDDKHLIIREVQLITNNEIPPYTCWNGYHQKHKRSNVVEDKKKRKHLHTTAGNVYQYSQYEK